MYDSALRQPARAAHDSMSCAITRGSVTNDKASSQRDFKAHPPGRGTISYPIWYNFLSTVFCCILFCILLYFEKFRKYAVFCCISKV